MQCKWEMKFSLDPLELEVEERHMMHMHTMNTDRNANANEKQMDFMVLWLIDAAMLPRRSIV
jgi:hypothetical protein